MKLVFPAAVLEQHIAVLGKTGSGKSSVVRYIVEELIDANEPVCIIDPKGDWWGLKSSGNGRDPGLLVTIFGGPHAEVPLSAHAGAAVGEIVATSGFPILIDLSDFTVSDRTRFTIDFVSTVFRKTRGKRFLVWDEVHNFIPQGKVPDPMTGQMIHWMNRLITEGRGKGVTIICASQRPQKVHKDFLTSCETLVAMRAIHRLDRQAMADWLDGAPDQDAAKRVLADLANLKRGIGWTWSPEIGFGPKLIEYPRFRTYDSFKPQAAHEPLKGWSKVETEQLRERLKRFVAEAEANDPRLLHKRIDDLEEALAKAHGAGPSETEVLALRSRYRAEDLETGRAEAWAAIGEYTTRIAELLAELGEAGRVMQETLHLQQRRIGVLAGQLGQIDLKRKEPKRELVERKATNVLLTKPQRKELFTEVAREVNAAIGVDSMPAPVRKLLTVLAQNQHRALTKHQMTTLAGYRASGKVSAAFTILNRNEWMFSAGDQAFTITSAGLEALGDYEPLPTGRALREHLLNGSRLKTPEKKILRVLCEAYPNALPKGRILELTGYAASGKVSAAFARLQTLGYADASGTGLLVASRELFAS